MPQRNPSEHLAKAISGFGSIGLNGELVDGRYGNEVALAIPILTLPSSLSSYVLRMTCCICIPPSRSDRAIQFRRAAPSRAEILLKMRMRVGGEVMLNMSTCDSALWMKDYIYLCISETEAANHCAAFCTLTHYVLRR
jgi:hypothetical protein